MTAPEMLTMNCPSDETLALFVEGKLDGDARAAVIEHLTECADCRDIVLMATDEATATTNNVTPIRRWLPYIAAAAAVLVLMFGAPAVWERFQADDLPSINGSFKERQVEGRLSIDAAHKRFRGRMRGGVGTPESRAEIAALRSTQRAEEHPTQENLHAAGLANLLALQTDDAIPFLERALEQGESVELLNDTAAAHLARGSEEDAAQALVLAERGLQLKLTPAGLWNRALALEGLKRDQDAIAAWNQYILHEQDAQWNEDARDHIDRLKPLL